MGFPMHSEHRGNVPEKIFIKTAGFNSKKSQFTPTIDCVSQFNQQLNKNKSEIPGIMSNGRKFIIQSDDAQANALIKPVYRLQWKFPAV